MTDISTQDEAAIRQARSAFNDALVRRDLPAIAAILHDDYFVVPSFSAQCFDKPGILDVYRDYFADPGFVTFDRTPDIVVISPDGERAAELGNWRGRWRAESGERCKSGTYHACWSRADLDWKLANENYLLLEG